VLPTRQFFDEPSSSDCSKKEVFENNENNMGTNFACENINEGEINKKVEDESSEVGCRRARVSIRARSDFSLVMTCISIFLFWYNVINF
jgi:hypothetical protein